LIKKPFLISPSAGACFWSVIISLNYSPLMGI
jgi:hypothetical protein